MATRTQSADLRRARTQRMRPWRGWGPRTREPRWAAGPAGPVGEWGGRGGAGGDGAGPAGTHRRAACPGPGRAGGRPWCRTCGRTAPAGRRRRSGSTRPPTACPRPGLGAAGSSSWPSCPCPRRRGTLRPGIRERQSRMGHRHTAARTWELQGGWRLGSSPAGWGRGWLRWRAAEAAVSRAPHPCGGGGVGVGGCRPHPLPRLLSAAPVGMRTRERSCYSRACSGWGVRARAECPPAFPSLLEPGGVTSLGNRPWQRR